MSDDLQLRNYVPSDLEAMFRLDEVCFEEPFRFTQSAMRRFAESRMARVIIADSAGELAGFGILHANAAVGYVVTLDVAAEFRQRGLARQLMQAMEHAAVDAGCSVVGLHVFVGNDTAIKFYERVGYVRAGDVPGFYGEGLDAWVYRKQMAAG